MNTEQMRQALLRAYPSTSWKNKVTKMNEQQVFAVYTRLKNQKKL